MSKLFSWGACPLLLLSSVVRDTPLLSMALCLGLVSCTEDPPNMEGKEIDPRLIGRWQYVPDPGVLPSQEDEVITLNPNGTCSGFRAPNSKQLFYTEEGYKLNIFVYGLGLGLKYSGGTYLSYYRIKGDTLYTWGIEEEFLTQYYDAASTYVKIKSK